MLSLDYEDCPSCVACLEFDFLPTAYVSILILKLRVDDRVRFEGFETVARCRVIPPDHF